MASDIALMSRERVVEELTQLRAELRAFLNSPVGEGLLTRLRALLPDEGSTPPDLPVWTDVVAAGAAYHERSKQTFRKGRRHTFRYRAIGAPSTGARIVFAG
jgi:hypothetical protein